MNFKKICINEAIALFIIIIINQVILGVSKEIITDTASSAWLHTIFLSLLAFFLFWIICKLFAKFINLDIIDISKFLAGNILKTIVCIALIGFFILSAALIIAHMGNCLSIIYLSNTNVLFIILLFFIGSIFIARYDINVIAKTALIVLWILFIPVMALFIYTGIKFDFTHLTPLLGYGLKETFFDNLTNLYAFSGLIYLFLITPLLKDTTKFKRIGIISVVISSLYLLFTVISLLVTFPFASITEDLLSVYLLAKAISFGPILERVDALYIFLWILSTFSYLSIIFYFLTSTFQKMCNLKNRSCTIYAFASIVLGVTLSIKNVTDLRFYQRIIFSYYFLALFVLLFIILLLAYLKSNKKPIPLK